MIRIARAALAAAAAVAALSPAGRSAEPVPGTGGGAATPPAAAPVGAAPADGSSPAAVPIDPALPAYAPAALSGPADLRSVGSDAMETLMKRWAGLFRAAHPGAAVAIEAKSPSDALPALGSGKAQLAPMGRRAYREERARFEQQFGYPPLEITVARCTYDADDWPHPHAIIVNPDNPLTRITLDEADAIFSSTRLRGGARDIATWGQLGLTGAWANQPIHLYGIDIAKGPGRFFREQALGDGAFKPSLHQVPGEEAVAPLVAADRFGIGFTGIPFSTRGVRRLDVAEHAAGPYVAGTRAEVAAGRYPLARVIYIYVNRPPGHPVDPATAEFLRLALSRDGQAAALAETYLPLSAERVRTELAKLN